LGVVSDALRITLVLQPISWFLLAIFFGTRTIWSRHSA
jgi:hypothetical protein